MVKQYKDPTEFFEYVDEDPQQDGRPGRRGRAPGAHRAERRQLQKAFKYVDELERELKQVQSADPAWKATAIAGVVLQDLTLQKSLAQNEAGQLAQRRLKRVSKEIQELIKQAIKVEYETINGQKNKLEASLRNEQAVPANVANQMNITAR